jgi:hypothetical protein
MSGFFETTKLYAVAVADSDQINRTEGVYFMN